MAIRTRTESRLLDAAEELFFTRGITATPVDAVLERAGVSAATLYRGYPSKEALLAAALERRHLAWLAAWDRAVDRQDAPEGRLLAVFDALDDFRQQPVGSRWCAFLGSAAEYADAPPEVAEAVRRDTDALRDRLTALAAPVAGQHAGALAEQLLLVVTGDLAMRLRDPGYGTATARAVAAALVAAR
jgi:AcrR family transcriptional regulator